jgi:RNA polymerase sigma-70 factor (ECF subfamily)
MAERPPDDPRTLVGRLYDTHGGSLYRYAVMLLADAAAAEDAVQQVFAALLRLSAAITIDDAAHYLRRAVRNECYSMMRRRKSRGDDASDRRDRTDGHNRPLLEPIADAGAPPPDERLALERALRALPPEQREVVHLHVFEGMTFQEIANASSESINTIASRYRYALVKLRDLLKKN